ncbi:MAG TPA: tetratricopeptide repeat protein, partial [Actinomycetes bacterium]|nr:tetratricopeptide repeat protein [Actinomycetes bacterium]
DVGRDAEARRQLDVLEANGRSPTATVLAAEIASALDSPQHAEPLRRPLADRAGDVVGWHGSLARHLGLVCHVMGLWGEAERRFDAALRANEAAGAPVAVAHTCRQYSALLRARGDEGDWERAIDLLSRAAAIYRRLEMEPLAEQAEVVLRRSQDVTNSDAGPPVVNVFRRVSGGWELAFDGGRAVVPDVPGLGHIATLIAAEGRPVHAVDLVETDQAESTYRARLADLEAQLAAPDPVAAALARAERDFLRAELAVVAAGRPPAGEVGDRARRLAALRIRTCLDGLDHVIPALAHHLRRSIRTGTFCLYEPQRSERWTMGL